MRSLLMLLVLVLGCRPGLGAEFGRLFSTSAERRELDRQRHHHFAGTHASESDFSPKAMRLDGIVHTKDGRTTAWINGRALTAGDTVDGVRLLEVGRHYARIHPPGWNGFIELRPGESWSASYKEPVDGEDG